MFWLVIPFLLSSLLPYVGCDLSTHRRDKSHLAAVTFDSATTSSSASSASKAASTPPVNPVVNITAVFEEEDLDDFLPIFERALADLVNDSMTFTWAGHVLSSSRDLKRMMTEMCAHFQGDKSQVRLIVVFGRVRTVQTVNLISQALGIPVIGYMLDKGDGYIQVHNPLFISLQPSNKHLARGLVSLLSANFWFRLTIITQTELRHDGFYNTFRELTKNGKWKIEDEIFISKGASNAAMNASFERVSGNTSRIFVLHATASLTRRIFVTAKQVLPRQGRFAWIITENAYTRSENVLHVFPLGTKAFLVNHDVVAEELLRDVLDFTMEAFQGDGNGRSALISRLITSPPSSSFSLSRLSSSLASLHISSYSGKNKAYGCWSARSDVIQPHQDPVYSALLSTSIYGLTGQMAFDEDGFMNISKFRVRNLVFDGRQSVWQDIGCVQGREVRPFRIIWPGDAKNLKAETEGKKRYKVVTNPVQPFVITEAPHADYGQCLSDTPCLNLTHKFKSQEVVWRAIEAFENGEGSESGLFTIQCCRGLTIDLLNKLSSDLEFEFTLYIVQDETYGQKAPNGSWSGMMRDLTDNTAHFAVAAFSITSQREGAIDFTDPYFFSGFSVIYSDRTRETSMLAFLEPFSTKVWFAIFVSAHITAVCMALLEWNSPFGLNPWGRKRNKNYSIASGLTMVFSVLFGHTVRAKSPKAWPSKFLQNIWAFAAIFIIASYTANLAAFIAGKHAGINYSDIQDTRLQDIRIGVLQGSAVHEFLKNSGSKLATVAERFHVRKTDEGVDWVIRGKLDALLGDYPILDYARAHLAPSCELKLISKVFGVDRYGLGLPKESPLKAALSKKISEYHRIGFIDDLIDVHFADAHCIKKRISEEDSQLEVTHHAGLFVMLCVGFGVGVLVLLLEHLIYKFLVPFMRQCPEDSTWRSVHLMFVSQRLQRTITSAELVSPHHSAHEMLGIFKKREFARLFQKSTIRRNRLADIAKTKRINRNFYDIVEKAKWLKDMKDSGLMDDDTLSTPSITEIPLKQLTVDVERGTLAPMMASTGASSATVPASNYTGIAPVKGNYSSESSSPESDDSLLGGSRMVTDKSLPISNHSTHPVLTIQALRASPSMSARRLRKQPRDHRYRHHRSHHMGMVSSPELDTGPNNPLLRDDCSYSHSNKVRSLSANSISPIVFLDSPPNNIKHKASSRSSLPTASVVNELSPACTPKQHIPLTVDNATASRVTFSTSLPNGNLVQRLADVDTEGHDSDVDTDSEDEDDDDDDGVCRQSIPNILSNPAFMLKAHSDSTHNLACAGASASNYSNNSLLPKTSNITLARTLLYKTRSIQDQLCSAADSAQAEAPMEPFCLDAVTKEELLVLWKSSEIELNKRLEAALREKARLERKLAMLQMHSPV